jgi:Mitochondrial carrier protein
LIGAGIQVFEVSSLGQPFEVVKTQMAANSKQGLVVAIKNIYKQGGVTAFWRGLVPWYVAF